MKVFILIWFGQLISLIGSNLTSFALGVRVYQNTGSVTQFALITMCAALPLVVVSPIAGTLVDRWSRRWTMILSDCGSGMCTVAIALLVATGTLQIWHIYLIAALNSLFSAFQWPAYTAATTLLVPKEQLSRATGMVQSAEGIAQILSPAIAGVLLVTIGLRGIIFLDLSTFGFALLTLLFVRFPELETSKEEISIKALGEELLYGLTYITTRPGLVGILIFFSVINLFVGLITVLFPPLVLELFSPVVLGTVESISGMGMLAGSLLMIIWKGPAYRINTVFGVAIFMAVSIMAVGLHSSIFFLSIGGFLFLFGSPVIRACLQVIWQTKVAPEVQGRVFALRRMITQSCIPLAALLAGPLDDYIFEPLMSPDGPLAASLGQIIGVGTGRGIDLLLIFMGLSMILTTFLAYLYPPLRLVESQLPDVPSSGEPEIEPRPDPLVTG
ncbi:MFS transporter [Tolypothrix sp. VBCCA 56010]|uniref:MFS transporter n=1 Tax=Tolypothrix sp. VBCCA 56010 TaxID=3137731 RepID=UPI003D7EA6A0